MKILIELINNPIAYIYNQKIVHWIDEEDEISETEYNMYDLTGDESDCEHDCGEEDNDN